MAANLFISFPSCSALLQTHSSQNSIPSVFLFNSQYCLLQLFVSFQFSLFFLTPFFKGSIIDKKIHLLIENGGGDRTFRYCMIRSNGETADKKNGINNAVKKVRRCTNQLF